MHFFNMSWDDVMNLPITRYNVLIEQGINLMSGYRQAEFDLMTENDKYLRERAEYDAFKEFEAQQENLDGG